MHCLCLIKLSRARGRSASTTGRLGLAHGLTNPVPSLGSYLDPQVPPGLIPEIARHDLKGKDRKTRRLDGARETAQETGAHTPSPPFPRGWLELWFFCRNFWIFISWSQKVQLEWNVPRILGERPSLSCREN